MKDKLDKILNNLSQNLYTPFSNAEVSAGELPSFIADTICVLPCGGESKRMAGLTDKHKTALSLPGGETLISRTVRSYNAAGIHKFLLLVGVGANSVIESTRDLREEGIEISYCPDPEKPVGRGGAILNAILQGYIKPEQNTIVHNADDQIVGYPGSFLNDICEAHIAHRKAGGLVTAIIARATPYAYTAFRIQHGMVTDITPAPMIPVPAHAGVTVMSPDVYSLFTKLFNLTEKKDFEGYLFPILAREKKLFAFGIPGNCWYPVNNPKEYESLVKALSKT